MNWSRLGWCQHVKSGYLRRPSFVYIPTCHPLWRVIFSSFTRGGFLVTQLESPRAVKERPGACISGALCQ